MSKVKKFLASPAVSMTAFVLAAGLLLFSSIGGARAATQYQSGDVFSNIELKEIGVELVENDTPVAPPAEGNTGVLLGNMILDGGAVQPGRKYPEVLNVRNSGQIGAYVRVSIYKYWTSENGDKLQDLDSDLIGLNLTGAGNGWIEDASARTREREVLYYERPVAVGDTTPAFADSLTIDNRIVSAVKQESVVNGTLTTVTTTYEYDGARFCVEARVDAVQEHNAADAILSAWGRKVNIAADGRLSLAD